MSEKNVLWICLTAKYEPDAVSFVTSSVTELVILSLIRCLETVAMVTVVAVAKPVTSVAELRFQSRPQTSLRVQFAKYSRVETRGGNVARSSQRTLAVKLTTVDQRGKSGTKMYSPYPSKIWAGQT